MSAATRLFDGTRNCGSALARGVQLEVHQCGTCGVIFGIEDTYMVERRRDHKGWKCPNGHSFVFNGPSDIELARREAQEARSRAQRAEAREDNTRALLKHEERSHAATKGHLTRGKKRAKAALCPVPGCHRHFVNMERHLETKHPDFTR